MPVTILNPYRSEPWAHAIQGLSGALEAYQRYKADDKEYKLKLEEAKLRREESEQMRKVRDQDMAIRDRQLAKQAEEEAIQEETERSALGESLSIGKGAADLSALIDETTKTSFIKEPPPLEKIGASFADLTRPVVTEQAGPPTAAIESPATTGPFGGQQIDTTSALTAKPPAPLEAMIQAPELDPNATAAGALATRQAASEADFVAPTGEMTPRERALGREAIKDREARKAAAQQEQADLLRDSMVLTADMDVLGKKRKAGERVSRVEFEMEMQAKRDEAADERARIREEGAAKRQEASNEAAFRRAELSAQKAAAAQAAKDEKEKFKQETSLRKEYDHVAAKPKDAIRVMDRYVGDVARKIRTGERPTAAEQYGLIYAFNKALDPTSVVRESEFANTQRVAAGYTDRAYRYYKQALSGEMLTDRQISEMMEVITNGRAVAQRDLDTVDQRFRELAIQSRIEPEMIFGASAERAHAAKENPDDPLALDDRPQEVAPGSGIKRPKGRP